VKQPKDREEALQTPLSKLDGNVHRESLLIVSARVHGWVCEMFCFRPRNGAFAAPPANNLSFNLARLAHRSVSPSFSS
jgi:hypothetical protein